MKDDTEQAAASLPSTGHVNDPRRGRPLARVNPDVSGKEQNPASSRAKLPYGIRSPSRSGVFESLRENPRGPAMLVRRIEERSWTRTPYSSSS